MAKPTVARTLTVCLDGAALVEREPAASVALGRRPTHDRLIGDIRRALGWSLNASFSALYVRRETNPLRWINPILVDAVPLRTFQPTANDQAWLFLERNCVVVCLQSEFPAAILSILAGDGLLQEMNRALGACGTLFGLPSPAARYFSYAPSGPRISHALGLVNTVRVRDFYADLCGVPFYEPVALADSAWEAQTCCGEATALRRRTIYALGHAHPRDPERQWERSWSVDFAAAGSYSDMSDELCSWCSGDLVDDQTADDLARVLHRWVLRRRFGYPFPKLAACLSLHNAALLQLAANCCAAQTTLPIEVPSALVASLPASLASDLRTVLRYCPLTVALKAAWAEGTLIQRTLCRTAILKEDLDRRRRCRRPARYEEAQGRPAPPCLVG